MTQAINHVRISRRDQTILRTGDGIRSSRLSSVRDLVQCWQDKRNEHCVQSSQSRVSLIEEDHPLDHAPLQNQQ